MPKNWMGNGCTTEKKKKNVLYLENSKKNKINTKKSPLIYKNNLCFQNWSTF